MYVLLDFLFYTFLFPEEYISKAVREEPLMQWVFPGLLIASLLFSYLFGEMAKGQNKVQEGLKYGLAVINAGKITNTLWRICSII